MDFKLKPTKATNLLVLYADPENYAKVSAAIPDIKAALEKAGVTVKD